MQIRLAQRTDLPAIVAIYNQAIHAGEQTADTTPFTVTQRRRWFDEHAADSHPVYVAVVDEDVVGYLSLSAYRSGREALKHTAEISYYLNHKFLGQRIGSRLMEYVLEQCPHLGIKVLFAILIASNQASIGLLKKFGFEEWGYLPGVGEINGREIDHVYYGRKV